MGPLNGYRIIELAGLGPGPFAAMMLSDMGADVIRVDRIRTTPPTEEPVSPEPLNRGRRSISVDLKKPAGIDLVLKLIEGCDGLIEGFRPGVMERLGLGPDVCLDTNGRLVYGRMTGWGQSGPYASAAGHDINYIALAGALYHIGRAGQAPTVPANLIGDFGGGGMLLAFGMVCGLLETSRSGQGQVIDAAMVDGASLLMNFVMGLKATGLWDKERGENLLDGGAPFYDVYQCADGQWISVGSIEPQFYGELLRLTGLDSEPLMTQQMDRSRWVEMKQRLHAVFKTKTRSQWCELMEHSDVCFAPVLSIDEAVNHQHNLARSTFDTSQGYPQANPAPRFSRTTTETPNPPPRVGADSTEIMSEAGYDPQQIEQLLETGVVAG